MASKPTSTAYALAAFCCTFVLPVLSAGQGWAWGNDGHKIIAHIAALHLSAQAREKVAGILGVPPTEPAFGDAMAEASIVPDWDFRDSNPETFGWHFINICRTDRRDEIERRCPIDGCVTEKIQEYRKRLASQKYDRFGPRNDLSLLIHFVGDVHQPLHCTTNADNGGNCQRVAGGRDDNNLHYLWDTEVVTWVEGGFGSRAPRIAAEHLNNAYLHDTHLAARYVQTLNPDDWAWESHEIAETEVYEPLGISKETCQARLPSCDTAPSGVRNYEPSITSAYRRRARQVADMQLTKAGVRLAALLNQIYE